MNLPDIALYDAREKTEWEKLFIVNFLSVFITFFIFWCTGKLIALKSRLVFNAIVYKLFTAQ